MNWTNLLKVGIIIIILGFNNFINAQSTTFNSCGFNESHNELLIKDNKYKTKHEAFEKSLLRYDDLSVDKLII